VHETLYNSRDSSVAFDDVLDSLVTHALEISPRMNELRIDRTGQFGSLEPRIATPLALVITELIHNALEHGLAEEGLALGIHVSSTASELSVTISDDGVGFPEGFDIATSANLGLQIVRTLTENELRGNLSLETDEKETRAVLTFPNV